MDWISRGCVEVGVMEGEGQLVIWEDSKEHDCGNLYRTSVGREKEKKSEVS